MEKLLEKAFAMGEVEGTYPGLGIKLYLPRPSQAAIKI